MPSPDYFDYLGELKLTRGGTAGEKRRPYIRLGNRAELLAGETLTGTPTATVEGSSPKPTTSAVAYGTVNTGTELIPNCLLFTVTVGTTAPAGRYVCRFHAETSGGAIYEPWCYLTLQDSRPT